MPQRRFPRPWRFEPIPGGYRVIDANGLALAHVYGEPPDAIAISLELTLDLTPYYVAAGLPTSRVPANALQGIIPPIHDPANRTRTPGRPSTAPVPLAWHTQALGDDPSTA